MRASGIIAEYNPFHNGHKYQLEEVKKITGAEVTVAVISGNFVERGEPAILSKEIRTQMALSEGVDLVVEMPVLFAMNNSDYFAKAGVEILESLGVKYICFGSETGNLSELNEYANFLKLNENEIDIKVRELIKEGYSYPRALEEVSGKSFEPNDILGISYLKHMKNAEPIAIRRIGEGHIESASRIRERIILGESISDLVPAKCNRIFEENRNSIVEQEDFFSQVIQKILLSTEDELNGAFGAEEGLGSKLKKNVRKYENMEDILSDLKSKRYTRTRVNRVLFSMLLGITREDVNLAKNYIRVLGFNETGAKYLKEVKRNEKSFLPILTNINKEVSPEIEKTLSFDILATDLYNLASKKDLYENSENVKKPLKF